MKPTPVDEAREALLRNRSQPNETQFGQYVDAFEAAIRAEDEERWEDARQAGRAETAETLAALRSALEQLGVDLVQDHRGIPYDVIAEVDRIAALAATPAEAIDIRTAGAPTGMVRIQHEDGTWCFHAATPAEDWA